MFDTCNPFPAKATVPTAEPSGIKISFPQNNLLLIIHSEVYNKIREEVNGKLFLLGMYSFFEMAGKVSFHLHCDFGKSDNRVCTPQGYMSNSLLLIDWKF